MSQHDYNIANQDGASFRGDLNSVLAAIQSCNSGATAPTTTTAYMLWFDTTTGLLKQRNAANTDWSTLADVMLAGKTINGLLYYTNQLTAGTAQATTSGTAIPFTGIPSWVKRITMSLNAVSTNGTANLLVQIGSGSYTSTGYASNASVVSAGTTTAAVTSGFVITEGIAASDSNSGSVVLTNLSGNIWTCSGVVNRGGSGGVCLSAGVVTLGGTLDRIRLNTVGGAGTFDGGSVNILYE